MTSMFNNDNIDFSPAAAPIAPPIAQVDALALHVKLADMSQPDLGLGTTPMDPPLSAKEGGLRSQTDKLTHHQGEMVAGTMKALESEMSEQQLEDTSEAESKQGLLATARDEISAVATDAYERVAESAQAARSILPGQSDATELAEQAEEVVATPMATSVDVETSTTSADAKAEAPVEIGLGVFAKTKQAIVKASNSAIETIATSAPAKVITEQAQAAKLTFVQTAGLVRHKAEEATHTVAQTVTQTTESAKQSVIETAVAAKNKAAEIWSGEAPKVEQAKQDVKDAASEIKLETKQTAENIQSDISAQTSTPELEADKAQAKAELRGLKNQIPAVLSAIASISTTVVAETARAALQKSINVAADAFEETEEDKKAREEVQHGVTYDESKHHTTAEQDRVNNSIDNAKGNVEQNVEEAERTASQLVDRAKVKAEDVCDDAQFELEVAKDKVKETASDLSMRAQVTANEVAANVKDQAQDIQEVAGVKKEQLKQGADEVKETMKDKASEMSAKAEQTSHLKQTDLETKKNLTDKAPEAVQTERIDTSVSSQSSRIWIPVEEVTEVESRSYTASHGEGANQQENLELLHALPFDESKNKQSK